MKLTNILLRVAILSGLLCFAQTIHAQNVYGRSEMHYDSSSRMMTAISSTEIDYVAQEYYQGYVTMKITDAGGNVLANASYADQDRDGSVETTNQFAAGADGSEYTVTGTHRGRMSIQDPALNYRYVDYYYFSFMSDMGREGANVWRWVMVYGRGPKTTRPTSMITVAGTIDANIALQKPGGYDAIDRAWDNLSNDEKKFVVAHPVEAAGFLIQAEQAIEDTASRFSQSDMEDGKRGNAFQHAMWNALMAQWRPEYAADFANAHEQYPGWAQWSETPFRNMDLHNNEVGRQIGLDNRFVTRQALANLIMNALNSNQLQVVCPPTCRKT